MILMFFFFFFFLVSAEPVKSIHMLNLSDCYVVVVVVLYGMQLVSLWLW